MNLKEEMTKYILDETDNIIDVSKAIEVAEKYAESKCREQKEIIAKLLKDDFKKCQNMRFDEFMKADTFHSWEITLNAPLATDN